MDSIIIEYIYGHSSQQIKQHHPRRLNQILDVVIHPAHAIHRTPGTPNEAVQQGLQQGWGTSNPARGCHRRRHPVFQQETQQLKNREVVRDTRYTSDTPCGISGSQNLIDTSNDPKGRPG